MTKRTRRQPKPAIIELPPEDYEPTKEELEEDLSVDTRGMSLREIFQAFFRPVEIKRVGEEDWREKRTKSSTNR